MKYVAVGRFVSVLALACVVVAVGCGPIREVRKPEAQLRRAGILHLAVVPLALPDGQPSADLMPPLLAEVAELAGGYTRLDQVTGGWKPAVEEPLVQESNCVLLVAGPPRVALFLRRKLAEDFQQAEPFVISLPFWEFVPVDDGDE